MQMRRGRYAGVARVTQQLTTFDIGTDLNLDAVHVPIDGSETVVMDQFDHVAQATVVVL